MQVQILKYGFVELLYCVYIQVLSSVKTNFEKYVLSVFMMKIFIRKSY